LLFPDLVKRLEEVRSENGSIEEIGRILTDWIPTLRPYIPYCANQLEMKNMLLHKTKENKHFSDFLQVCDMCYVGYFFVLFQLALMGN